jgi:hypothetical protein
VGVLPSNACVVLGNEPLLIDTGLRAESDDFLEALGSLVDPADLALVFLTHDDADHTGSIERVMALAREAGLITHGLAALRTKLTFDIPLDRVHAVVAGDELNIGGRSFQVFRPPLFDGRRLSASTSRKRRRYSRQTATGPSRPAGRTTWPATRPRNLRAAFLCGPVSTTLGGPL